MREFFDVLQWDVGQDIETRQEARILCPNDHAHSSPDDVFGCWIKDGTGTTPFAIYCHHNGCRGVGTLDQLVELERYVGLPDEYDTLSDLLCQSYLYTSFINEDDGACPARHHYLRWDPREDEPGTPADAKQEVVQ